MDGAPFVSIDIAHGKAWTAAAFRLPSAARGDQAKELVAFSSAISAATHGRYTPQIGALPIERRRRAWARRAPRATRTRRS